MANTKDKKLRFAVLATDVVLFTWEGGVLKVLLIPVHLPPHFSNKEGLPGGLILPTETADDSVRRHLGSKAGFPEAYIEQLYSFSKIDRDPRGRVVSVAYFGLVPESELRKSLPKTRWVKIDDVPTLAYDHDEILGVALKRLQAKLQYTTIAQYLLPPLFSLSELQMLYETILGRKLDKRNFRKKFMSLKILKETKSHKRDGAHRPAQLYQWVKKNKTFMNMIV